MKKQYGLAAERDIDRWLNEGGRDVERSPHRSTHEPKPRELADTRAGLTTYAKETRQ